MSNLISSFILLFGFPDVIAAIWTIVLITGSAWQLWNRESRRRLREQLAATKADLASKEGIISTAETTVNLYKEQTVLIRSQLAACLKDRDEHLKVIASLQAKTNLEGLSSAIVKQHQETVALLKKESKEAQLMIMQMIQDNTKTLMQVFAEHSKKDQEIQNQMVNTMDLIHDEIKGLSRRINLNNKPFDGFIP